MQDQYKRVRATPAELTDWRRRKTGRRNPGRIECRLCGKRLWNSGLAIGAHNRSRKCPPQS